SEVPLRSVDATFMLRVYIGYIRVSRFEESTNEEHTASLLALELGGVNKLVLHLPNNPGGYLGIAEAMADEFLEDGKLILFTKNKSGAINKSYATKKGTFEQEDIYVLINEKSASASEILAGAIQDND